MKLKIDIPGQMTIDELKTVATLAASVPVDGIIVELGALFGLSSWHFAQNASKGTVIYSIDPWNNEPWIDNLMKTFNIDDFGLDAFKRYTADASNIIPVKAYSPSEMKHWDKKIDLFFDDAVHENPTLNANLEFWRPFVKKGGIIGGHDFCNKWPDVKAEADRLAKIYDTKLNVVGTVWWINT